MNPLRNLAESFGYNLERRDRQVVAMENVRRIIGRFGVDCVLDVGAHKGGYGRSLRRVGYRGAIASFEPQASAFAILEQTIVGLQPWTAHRTALGDTRGTLQLVSHRRSDLASLLPLNRFGEQTYGPGLSGMESVQITRGDEIWDIVAGASSKVFLKCDTQGFDLKVLEGFGRKLDQVVGVQVEASFIPIYEKMPDWSELAAYLIERGFSVSGFYPVSRSDDLKIVEADMMFVR
ncbi:MAG: FkbM family methyltransferase [Burkholderiales bacterium]